MTVVALALKAYQNFMLHAMLAPVSEHAASICSTDWLDRAGRDREVIALAYGSLGH
jgi:hypothetical protein